MRTAGISRNNRDTRLLVSLARLGRRAAQG
jgi:hypothetical protein